MITGVNRVFEHEGRQYHIQTEDLGEKIALFEIRVYVGGTVLWRKRVSYDELARQSLGRQGQEEALRALMEKTLQTVCAAIAKGKLA